MSTGLLPKAMNRIIHHIGLLLLVLFFLMLFLQGCSRPYNRLSTGDNVSVPEIKHDYQDAAALH